MKTIDIYYQGEGSRALEHTQIADTATFGAIKAHVTKAHPHLNDCLLFIEGEETPVDEHASVSSKAKKSSLKIHISRCRKVRVTVHFKDKSVHDDFAPGITIAHVKTWAAVRKLGMSEEDASHHHLQINGTTDQPDPGVHVGSLVQFTTCSVTFDLVATPRVNG